MSKTTPPNDARARFLANPVTAYILEMGTLDLKHLASVSNDMDWSDEDRAEFAEFFGHFVDHWNDTSIASGEPCTPDPAGMHDKGADGEPEVEMIPAPRLHIEGVKASMGNSALYQIHTGQMTLDEAEVMAAKILAMVRNKGEPGA